MKKLILLISLVMLITSCAWIDSTKEWQIEVNGETYKNCNIYFNTDIEFEFENDQGVIKIWPINSINTLTIRRNK